MRKTSASWAANPAPSRKATACCWSPRSPAARNNYDSSIRLRQRGTAMAYYALFYEVVGDFIARRGAYRDEHLRLAREAYARGELVLAGALADPADGALIVFQGESAATAEAFARQDPYVKN